jgi:hypothetical protein
VSRMVRPEGLEPPAYWFEASRSIQLSYGRTQGESAHSIADACGARVRGDRGRTGSDRYARITFCLGVIVRSGTSSLPLGPVAQLAEQQTLNLRVVGSIPTRLTSTRVARAGLAR